MADHDTHDHTGVPGCGTPADIVDIPTAETDASLVLAPDGAGGVEFRAEAGGSSGALVYLTKQIASTSASLDFSGFINSAYDVYQFEIVNIVNASSNQAFNCQMGTGGGPTWDTGSNYGWAMQDTGPGGQFNLGNTSGVTSIRLAHDSNGAANYSINGTLKLYTPSSSVYKLVTGHMQSRASDSNFYLNVGSGVYISTTAVTGIRFLFASGNITSGVIYCYGIKNS